MIKIVATIGFILWLLRIVYGYSLFVLMLPPLQLAFEFLPPVLAIVGLYKIKHSNQLLWSLLILPLMVLSILTLNEFFIRPFICSHVSGPIDSQGVDPHKACLSGNDLYWGRSNIKF